MQCECGWIVWVYEIVQSELLTAQSGLIRVVKMAHLVCKIVWLMLSLGTIFFLLDEYFKVTFTSI